MDGNPRVRLVVSADMPPTGDRLFPGASRGNRFRIVLRDVELPPDERQQHQDAVLQIVEQVRCRGFVNYFGQQRFGGAITRHTQSALLFVPWAAAEWLRVLRCDTSNGVFVLRGWQYCWQ